MGDITGNIPVGTREKFKEQSGCRDPVGIIISEDKNLLPTDQGAMNSINSPVHVLEQKRVADIGGGGS